MGESEFIVALVGGGDADVGISVVGGCCSLQNPVNASQHSYDGVTLYIKEAGVGLS